MKQVVATEKDSIGLTFDIAKISWILWDRDVHVSGAAPAPDATYRQLGSSPEPGTGNKIGIQQAAIGLIEKVIGSE